MFEGERITEWFGAASNVTERKQAEERLHEADRHKNEYLAMLGHELRNPLGAIRNAVELLKLSGLEKSKVQRPLGVLERQSSHMATIIDGLLEVSRIARGKIDLQLDILDLCEVVDRVMDIREEHTRKRGLKLERARCDEPLWVEGDEVRLAQVLDNLMGNAIKFTEVGGTIALTMTRDRVGDTDWAVVCIRDTGVGIKQENLQRIFEPFRQGGQDVARTSGGMGLGLPLAKGLVELHHGEVLARSEGPGKGTEVEVRLPLSAPPSEMKKEKPAPSSAPRKILVVEDNEDAASTMQDFLRLSGHQVEVVSSGDEGLSMLRDKDFDLVLCDIGLPGISGHDVARAVRADPELEHLTLIALTGYGQPEDRKQTAQSGFDAHLIKPVSRKALEQVLSEH